MDMGERRYIPTNTLTHHKIMQQRASNEVKLFPPYPFGPSSGPPQDLLVHPSPTLSGPPDHLEVPILSLSFYRDYPTPYV